MTRKRLFREMAAAALVLVVAAFLVWTVLAPEPSSPEYRCTRDVEGMRNGNLPFGPVECPPSVISDDDPRWDCQIVEGSRICFPVDKPTSR